MGVGAGWVGRGLDLQDEVHIRRRRAKIVGWFAVAGLAGSVVNLVASLSGGPLVSGAWASPLVTGALAGGQVVVSVLALTRRERLGDTPFFTLVLLIVTMMVPGLLATTPRGSLRSAELILLGPLILGAVFCSTRLQVVAVTVLSVAGANVVSLQRLAGQPDRMAELAGEVITFVIISVVVRSLRESGLDALTAARRGEMTDPLTGLLNRRGFERSGIQAWGRRAADRKPVTLLMLDLDHFKQVNDRYGHAAGDELLRRTAALLQESLRSEDVAVRLGGEEFVVLMPADVEEGRRVAERLREKIEHELAPVTVSIGVVGAVPELSGYQESVDALWRAMGHADVGLYEAKQGGRNRVVVVPGTGAPGGLGRSGAGISSP